MKNSPLAQLSKMGLALMLLALGSNCFAGETWTLTSGADVNVGCTPNATISGGTIAQGSSCKNDLNVADMKISAYSTAPTNGGSLAAATIYDWGSAGLGIVKGGFESSGAAGPHAMDNVDGTDGMLFKFDSKTNLTSLTIGWNGNDNNTCYNAANVQVSVADCNYTGTDVNRIPTVKYVDSDISVWAWTGTGTPPASADASILGKNFNAATAINTLSLTSAASGWSLVGNYANVGQMTNPDNFVDISSSTPIFSSFWLVSAYTGGAAGSSCSNCTTQNGYMLDSGNDAFKLLQVAGSQKSVPEPGSIVLLGLGLLGIAATRRRTLQAA